MPAALATTYFVYVPTAASVGGLEGEIYTVQGFDAHDGLSGAALIDASMAELVRMVGADVEAMTSPYAGPSLRLYQGADKDAMGQRPRSAPSTLCATPESKR